MKSNLWKAALGGASLIVAGCSGPSAIDSQPLFFAQGITFGVSAGTAPQNGNTPELTVGYKQLNIALVPTVIAGVVPTDPETPRPPLDKDTLKNMKILGTNFGEEPGNNRKGKAKEDALSTFGSFDAETSQKGVNAGVNLGVFFATGVAASTLAEGFKEKLSGEGVETEKTAEAGGEETN